MYPPVGVLVAERPRDLSVCGLGEPYVADQHGQPGEWAGHTRVIRVRDFVIGATLPGAVPFLLVEEPCAGLAGESAPDRIGVTFGGQGAPAIDDLASVEHAWCRVARVPLLFADRAALESRACEPVACTTGEVG